MKKNLLKAVIATAGITMIATPTMVSAQANNDIPVDEKTKSAENISSDQSRVKPATQEEAKVRLDQAKEKVTTAKQDKDQKQKTEADLSQSLAEKTKVKTDVSKRIKTNDSEALKFIEGAKKAAGDDVAKLTKQVDQLERNMIAATAQVQEATKNKEEAEQLLKEKKAELDTLNNEHQNLDKDLVEAKTKLDAANTDVTNKEKAVQENKAAVEKAKADLGAKEEELTKAKANLQSKAAEVTRLEQDVKNKTDAKNQLENEYNAASKSHSTELKAAEKDVEDAKAVVKTKTDAVNTAKGEYDAAKQKLDETNTSLKTAKDNVANITNDIAEKTQKLNEINNQLNALKGNKDQENNKIAAAEGEKQQLEQSLSEKDESIKAVAKKVSDAKAKLEAAEKELATLKKARDDAKVNADSVEAESAKKLALGAKGFYESVGSTNAAKLFDNKTYYETIKGIELKKYEEKYVEAQTHMGQKDDTTSIENIQHAIHLLEDSAKLREKEGLNEIKVTDNMMAFAQRNVNWSSYVLGHFGNTDYEEHTPTYADGFNPNTYGYNGTFENLAWGYPGFGTGDPKAAEEGRYNESPFYGWYFEERNNLWMKEVQDHKDLDEDGKIGPTKGYTLEEVKSKGDPKDQTGHYTNFLGKYEFTGMAYRKAPGNKYRDCIGQEFMYASYMNPEYTKDPGNKGYTIDEYKARFDNYVNKIKAMPEEAKNDYNAKVAAYNAQVQKVDAIKTEITGLTNQQQAKESEKKQVQGQITGKDKDISKLKEAVKAIDQKIDKAKAEVAKVEGEKRGLEDSLNSAKKEQTRIEGLVTENADKTKVAENKYNSSKTQLAAAKTELNKKETALKNLQNSNGLSEIASRLDKARIDLDTAQGKLKVAKGEKADLEKKVAAAESEKTALEGKLSNLKGEETVLGNALAELKTKATNAKSTYDNLDNAKTKVDKAKKNLEKAQQAFNEAKTKLDKATKSSADVDRKLDKEKAELNNAKDKKVRADKLTWNSDQTLEVTDNDFKGINEFVKTAKDLKKQLTAAEKDVAELIKNHENAKNELDKANKVYNRALADLAIAQADYDSFINSGTTVETAMPLTGKWNKDNKGNWSFEDEKIGFVKGKYAVINKNTYKFDDKGVMATGWIYDKGAWYYFNKKGEGVEGTMVKKSWKKIGKDWYYFYDDGKMAKDTLIGDYYVNKKGAWRWNRWIKNSNGKWWYYYKEGNYPKNEMTDINGNRYHFDRDGYMTTGWYYDKGSWYYFNKNGEGTEGAMVKNTWKKIGKDWYYFYDDGKMAKDTVIGNYYVNKKGVWSWNHWIKNSNGKWSYYYKEGNYPKNEMTDINGSRYHFDKNGYMTTGWYYEKGSWYYFNKKGEGTEGAMVKDAWRKISGKWYYLDKDGVMAKDTIVKGYKVDKSGAWVK